MPRGPIGYANNLFFPGLLHPIVNFNTATSLLSTDSTSKVGILLGDAWPASIGSGEIKAPLTPIASPLARFNSWFGSFTDRIKCLLGSSVAQSPNSFGRKEVILGFKKW